MRLSFVAALVSVLGFTVVACGSSEDAGSTPEATTPASANAPGDDGDPGDVGGPAEGDAPMTPGDDGPNVHGGTEPLTTQATATGDVNLRKGPATTFDVIVVIPKGSMVTILNPTKQNEFYNVRFNGSEGWAHSNYLAAATGTTTPPAAGDVNGPPSVENAMARARLSKGFSYWWGGGAFPGVAVTSSNKGQCNGAGCPNCTHSGQYGADCSGMVAKAWQYGNPTMTVNSHPYSTADFIKDRAGKWSTVSRGAMKPADALVHNDNGSGHIVIYEKGDGWNSPTVYECKGCSYGCVYNARAFSSAYHAIRRTGF